MKIYVNVRRKLFQVRLRLFRLKFHKVRAELPRAVLYRNNELDLLFWTANVSQLSPKAELMCYKIHLICLNKPRRC